MKKRQNKIGRIWEEQIIKEWSEKTYIVKREKRDSLRYESLVFLGTHRCQSVPTHS